jgi:peptidyl-prolyl cis-trans isomerase D
MLQLFRNFFKSKLGVVFTLGFLALVALAFASSDIANTSVFGGIAGGDRVAVVGDRRIDASDLSVNATNALNQARQQNPTLTMQAFAANGGVEGVLEQMLSRAALAEFGREHGLRAGKRLVDSEIRKIPAFRDVSGNFSQDAYLAALRQQGLTDAVVREDLEMGLFARQVAMPIGIAPRMPASIALRYARLLRESRQGAIGLVPSTAFAPAGDPSAEQLQAYYQENRSDYIRPERRVIRYAVFGEEALGEQGVPTEAQIAARYRRDQALYEAQENRTFTQVIAPTEQAARQIVAAVRGGVTLEAAAGAQGLAAAEIGPVDRQGLTSQSSAAVAEAGFAGARGSLAEPARGGLGWYVLRVDAVETRPARTLAQAREEIAQALAVENRTAALNDLTARLEEEFDEGRNLAEIARELRLELVQTRPVTAAGQVYGTPESAPPVLAPVLDTAFDMEEEEPQLAVLAPGQFLIFDVSGITPSATAPLAEIRPQVVAAWKRDRGFAAAGEAAQRILQRVAGGQSLAQATEAETVDLLAVDQVDLDRQEIAQSGQVPPALALLFSMAEGTVKRLAAPANTGWFVVALDDIVTPELEAGDPLVAATANQLESVLSDEYVQQFLAAVEAEVGVERNDAAIQAVIAQLNGQAN